MIANGFDIEPEFVKELSRLNVKIDEVSIDYEPRSVKDGKKISFSKDNNASKIYFLILIGELEKLYYVLT